MWSNGFDRMMTATAIASVLALAALSPAALAQTGNSDALAVPQPDYADLPPLTLRDIAPSPKSPRPAVANTQSVEALIPKPDTADLPPLTASDIGISVRSTKQARTPIPQAAPVAQTRQAAAPAQSSIVTEVAEKLHGLAEGKFDRLLGNHKDRASIESFYKSRDFVPLWIAGGALDVRAKAAIKYLAGVGADGLNPADYPVPDVTPGESPEALAEAELRLTRSVVTYAHHAQTGQVHYTRVSADISFNLVRTEPRDVLAKLAASNDIAKTLDGFEPQHAGYKALKAKLAELRSGGRDTKPNVVRIEEGPILRPGMRDARVVALRQRLKISKERNSPVYDDTVFKAVKEFQKEHGLAADGLLGSHTLRVMNGNGGSSSARVIDTIIANMERWRWLPHNLGNPYVMVNIPDFTLQVVRDGKTIWKTKIVVGQPTKRTPLTSAMMKYITVNPTWNVPPSIIRNEYLPAIEQDPNALDRVGLKMERNPDGTIRIFQPPGDRNALGRIRFNFPNKFLVYQHDTPDKYLFSRYPRAYSHGCMRVQDPLKYAEILLGMELPAEHYTEARLHHMFGGSEININFPKPIPVHLTYQTAFVDADGKLQLRNDVYGLDAALLHWLKGDQRRIADTPIERPPSPSSQPVMMPPGLMARSNGGDGYGGREYVPSPANFFDRLFGFAEPPPPPPQYRRPYHNSWQD